MQRGNTMSAKFRVGIIGCGKRAYEHSIGLVAEKRLEVVALADLNQEAAQKLNSEKNYNASIYADYKEMLQKEKLDFVVICLWTPLHLPVFKECAAAGVKAVLSEKPMAPTWGESQELSKIAEETGCQLSFCHQRRLAKGNLFVKKMLEEGKFGEILSMELFSPPNLLDCGTHSIDQAMSFNQESPIKWVLGAVDATNPVKWFDVSAEEMAVGTIVFENGVRANLQVGGPDQHLWGGVRILGTEGFIEVFWDGNLKRGALYNDPSWKVPEIDGEFEKHMIYVMEHLVDCLESGEESMISHKKALATTEAIFAFYESVRRNARIELPLEGVNDNPFITMLENGEFNK